MGDASATLTIEDDEECEEEEDEVLDALLESVTERGAEPLVQNITKVRNGRLFVMRTPSEVGEEVDSREHVQRKGYKKQREA